MAKILCWVFGHQYQIKQEFGPYQRRIVCPRCCGDWAMHDGLKALVPWDGDFTKLYRDRGYEVK